MHHRLLIRPGAIGDCILALPELEGARAEYTEVWAPRAVLPLIRFADRTRAIADTGLDLVGVLPGAQVPALRSFDSIYCWYGTQHSEFREAVRHLPFTFFRALPPSPQGVPRIPVPAAPVGDFAVIHPFSGGPKKNWPLENFRTLAARLPLTVKWSAGPDEIFDDAVRFNDLYELGCWLSTARVYVGNDSGISHLAAAVGTPVVAIFTCTDPRVWAPRGAHVTVLENPSLEDVWRAVHLALDHNRGVQLREGSGGLLQCS
jgi:ADP-heptose:LPS heptosyltransferase